MKLNPKYSCELLLNCIFEILSTTALNLWKSGLCCELLLNCIFEILSTTDLQAAIHDYLL